MSQKTIVISSSTLDIVESCFKNYEFYKKDNLVPVNKSSYLERGSLVHYMAEDYYKNILDTGTRDIQKAVDFGRFSATKLDLPSDDVEFYIKTFREYCQYYSSDGWKILSVEESFSFILFEDENLKIILEGKLDLIVEILDGTRIIVDHKTSDKNYIPGLLSNQTIGYLIFARTVGIDHFIINQIGLQKTYKPAQKFKRHTLQLKDNVAQEWIDATVYHIRNLAICIEQDYYPRNYRNCRFCSYASICAEEENMRKSTIDMNFMKKPVHSLFPVEKI